MRWMPVWAVLSMIAAGCAKPPPPPEVQPQPSPNPPVVSEPPVEPAPAAAPTVELAKLEAVGQASKPYRLALVVKTRNNPFFTPMIEAAEAEAKALGVELKTEAPPQETDKEQQFAIVQQLVAGGIDALLIAPADSAAIVPALREAQAKGVTIINLDNRVATYAAESAGLKLDGYVGADNEEGGRLAGRALADRLQEGAAVAILEGIRGVDNAESRKRGFEQAVDGELDIVTRESAEWDTAKAYAKFQSMLAAYPNLVGLFCANDKMALGALQAIDEAGKTGRITVVGYDNIPEVREHLDSGALAATIEQHPDLMGRYGVKMAVGVLEGLIDRGQEYLVRLEVIESDVPETEAATEAEPEAEAD